MEKRQQSPGRKHLEEMKELDMEKIYGIFALWRHTWF